MSVEVTEFSRYLSHISFKIATEHYRYESFYENMVVVALQSIDFINADIKCSFYVCYIAVWKLQYLKPPKYLFPFCRLQTVRSLWSTWFPNCIWFSLQRRTITESS
jgi:hypothetical protein